MVLGDESPHRDDASSGSEDGEYEPEEYDECSLDGDSDHDRSEDVDSASDGVECAVQIVTSGTAVKLYDAKGSSVDATVVLSAMHGDKSAEVLDIGSPDKLSEMMEIVEPMNVVPVVANGAALARVVFCGMDGDTPLVCPILAEHELAIIEHLLNQERGNAPLKGDVVKPTLTREATDSPYRGMKSWDTTVRAKYGIPAAGKGKPLRLYSDCVLEYARTTEPYSKWIAEYQSRQASAKRKKKPLSDKVVDESDSTPVKSASVATSKPPRPPKALAKPAPKATVTPPDELDRDKGAATTDPMPGPAGDADSVVPLPSLDPVEAEPASSNPPKPLKSTKPSVKRKRAVQSDPPTPATDSATAPKKRKRIARVNVIVVVASGSELGSVLSQFV